MRARIVLALVMVLILTMAGSASVAAKGATVPFYSELATAPAVSGGGPGYFTLAIPGEGKATHLGKTTWSAACTLYPPPPIHQVCTMTFYAANGDELYGATDGFAQPGSTDTTFWGDFTITGGTGRFEGASGAGAYQGWAKMPPGMPPGQPGVGAIVFRGTLTKP